MLASSLGSVVEKWGRSLNWGGGGGVSGGCVRGRMLE